jgi:protein TonB
MHAALRPLIAGCTGLTGMSGVVGLVLAMNTGTLSRDDGAQQEAVAFQVESPPPKKKPKAKPKPKPKPQKRSNKPPPPSLSQVAGLTGLDFGLEAFGSGMGDDLDQLLGDVCNVVMTTDAVDDPPRPQRTVAPEYPARARKKGTTGEVRLSLLVGVDGRVRDVRVLSSQPPGVFDKAAIAAVKQWTYTPASYEGEPVATRVTQPVVFDLGR